VDVGSRIGADARSNLGATTGCGIFELTKV
jgi:hypothetical protein